MGSFSVLLAKLPYQGATINVDISLGRCLYIGFYMADVAWCICQACPRDYERHF